MSNGTLVPLGRYCENVLPPVHQSSGNRMVVHFRSDATTNGNGFSANWTSGQFILVIFLSGDPILACKFFAIHFNFKCLFSIRKSRFLDCGIWFVVTDGLNSTLNSHEQKVTTLNHSSQLLSCVAGTYSSSRLNAHLMFPLFPENRKSIP